jgi:bla regulator protein blaR1
MSIRRRFTNNPHFARTTLLTVIGIAAVATFLVFGIVCASELRAQSPQLTGAALPSFEVVSIKPNSNRNPSAMGGAGGDLSHEMMRLATAKALIQFAYNVRAFQVSGGPSWIESDRFDIDAKVDDMTVGKMQAMTLDQRLALRRVMYQSLLAERFELKIRRTTIEAPVYSLTVAKPGKVPVAQDCPVAAPPQDPSKIMCGGGEIWSGHLIENAVAIKSFIGSLTTVTGKVVLDNTELTGKYNIALDWTPDSARLGPPDPNSPFPPADPNGPTLQEALEEKLGLKLVSTIGPVENIVIDHIEQPSPN